jgi:hypothetical protein
MQAFGAFTPSMFDAFKVKIKQDVGVDLTKNADTVTHGSFVFTYDYNPEQQLLHIQCLKKPLFLPGSVIINGLAEEVAAIKAATQQAAVEDNENIIKGTQNGPAVDVHGQKV